LKQTIFVKIVVPFVATWRQLNQNRLTKSLEEITAAKKVIQPCKMMIQQFIHSFKQFIDETTNKKECGVFVL
jgi:hypothetical protein